MLLMRHIKNKKIALALFAFLLVCGLAVLASFNKGNAPDYLHKIYPDQEIRDTGDKQYRVGSDDIYVARISIGDTVLYQIFEKSNDKYRFFTTDEKPRLLKEVEVITPPQNADEALNKNFFLRDVT
jgi:hypothetical protein